MFKPEQIVHHGGIPFMVSIDEYRGFSMELSFDSFSREYKVSLKNELSHCVSLGTDIHGNITRLDNALEGFEIKMQACEAMLSNTKTQLENAKVEVERPFVQEDELKTKSARPDELNILLNMDQKDNVIIDGDTLENEFSEPRKNLALER